VLVEVPEELSDQRRLQLRFDEASTRIATTLDAERIEAHRRTGYLDREIEDLDRRIRLAQAIEKMSDEKAELAATISRLRDEMSAFEADRSRRVAQSDETIRDRSSLLLRCPRQRLKAQT
jgi:hypothetical protein